MRQYTYLLLVLLLLSVTSGAVELRELAVTFRKYPGKTYFAQLPDEQIREELSLDFDAQLFGCAGWSARVHGSSTDAQFRWIGFNPKLYCNIGKVQIFIEHHSEHALDMTRPEHFPVNDSVGVRWTLYEQH